MEEELTPCEVFNVFNSERGATVLLDSGKDRYVPIQVSSEQGRSIQLALMNREFFRPLTHDLMVTILRGQGIEIESIVIYGLMGSTMIAELKLKKEDKVFNYDVRPSDGLALALRTDSEIFMTDDLIDVLAVQKADIEQVDRAFESKIGEGSVDFSESDTHLSIVLELPELEKEEDLTIDVNPHSVVLKAPTPKGLMDRVVELPTEVERDQIEELSFTNKVLELRLKKPD